VTPPSDFGVLKTSMQTHSNLRRSS